MPTIDDFLAKIAAAPVVPETPEERAACAELDFANPRGVRRTLEDVLAMVSGGDGEPPDPIPAAG